MATELPINKRPKDDTSDSELSSSEEQCSVSEDDETEAEIEGTETSGDNRLSIERLCDVMESVNSSALCQACCMPSPIVRLSRDSVLASESVITMVQCCAEYASRSTSKRMLSTMPLLTTCQQVKSRRVERHDPAKHKAIYLLLGATEAARTTLRTQSKVMRVGRVT